MEQFLKSVRSHQFSKAQTYFNHGQKELLTPASWVKPPYLFPLNPEYRLREPEFITADSEIIFEAAHNMRALLKDQPRCLQLLKKLDADIQQYAAIKNWDFSKITPGKPIEFNDSIVLPGEPSTSLPLIPDTYHLHLFLIREELQKRKIETQSKLYRFCGSIESGPVKQLLAQRSLFTEDAKTGTLLGHGLDTHFFQWFIFSLALSSKDLYIDKRLSLGDMLQYFSEIEMDDGNLLWDVVIDYFIDSASHMHFSQFSLGSPERLNSLLLLSPEIPHLRGYLLNQWYLNITEIQAIYYSQHQKKIPYVCLVGANAASKSDGKGFKTLFKIQPTPFSSVAPFVNASNNIYYQDTNLLFAKARELKNKLEQTDKEAAENSVPLPKA